MKSIRTKLIIFFTLICIGCLGLTMIVATSRVKSKVYVIQNDAFDASAAYYSETIRAWFSSELLSVESATMFLNSLDKYDGNTAMAYFETIAANSATVSNIKVDFSNKNGSKDIVTIGTPYVNSYTGKMFVTASMGFTCKDGQEGVVNANLMLDNLFDEINATVDFTEGNYLFVTTEEGAILYHPNEEYKSTAEEFTYVNTVLNGAYATAEAKNTSFVDYDKVSKYLTSDTVELTGWKVYIVSLASSYDAVTNSLGSIFVLLMIISGIIAAVLVSLFSSLITKPIAYVRSEVDTLSEFKVEIRPDTKYENRKDEFGEMARAVKDLCKNLNGIVKDLQNSSNVLVSEFEKVNEAVDTSVAGNSLIKETIGQVVTAIDAVAGQTQDANTSLVEFSEELNKVILTMDEMSKSAVVTASKTSDGMKSIKTLSDRMDESAVLQKAAGDTVDALSEKSNSIGNISETISSIAEETSLLALNASIEAARAGEAGRGFAVVAEQIGKLATQTAEATNEITVIISDIQKEIHNVSNQMNTIQKSTEECSTVMEDTKNIFSEINGTIDDMNDNISNLGKNIDTIDASKQNIVDRFSDISSETEELSAAAQDIFSKVEDENEDILTIGSAMDQLKGVVDKLNGIVDTFEL